MLIIKKIISKSMLDIYKYMKSSMQESRTILPLFSKIPKWMIDSFHTRNNRRKSFDNMDSYFSMISKGMLDIYKYMKSSMQVDLLRCVHKFI